MANSDSGGGGGAAAIKVGVALLAAIVAIVAVVVVVVIGGGALCAPTADTNDGAGTSADSALPGQKVMPMKKGTYQLTSPFGMRDGTMHQGQDFGSTPNQPIYAAFDGVVDKAGSASGFGQWIVLNHNINGRKVSTVYGHMFPAGVLVKAGQKVTAGQLIAKVGYNGQVDPAGPGGAHLHFEVWMGGWGAEAVNPMPWLAGAVEPGSAAARPATTDTNVVSVADWNKIAQHESGGNWAISTGNGYYGGLQFSSSTWSSFGGRQYAATADKATPQQQMEVANKVLAGQGWDAWPTTSRQAGVRNKKPAPAGSFVGAAVSPVANVTTSSPAPPRAPPATPTGGLSSVTDSGGTLDISKPMDKRFGSEAHFQTNTVRLVRAVAQRFPQLKTIGGWRADGGGYSDHPDGRAADIMIPNWDTAEGKALGDAIQKYVMDNKKVFRVDYTIWRQRYTAASGETNIMEDRGGSTANHYDHVHVTVLSSPKYNGQDLGSITDRGQTSGGTTECNDGGDHGGGDGGPLKSGTVPPAWARWYVKAGGICREITSSLLAAQGRQESGFKTEATSDQGAKGPGQFMDGTWPTWGKDYDGDGKVDVRSPGDAIMAQGHFMCYMVGRFRRAGIKEPARGGIAALALAGYNAGEGAVEQYGGIPPYAQTINYVDVILTNEPGYRATPAQSADLAGVN